MPFSEKTLKVLAQAGWREGVVVDVPEDALRQRGYVVSPVVRKFLAAFGDLYYYVEPERRTMTVCHTRAADAARKLGAAGLAAVEKFVGVKLCPIGEAGHGNFIVLMDPHGCVFGVNQQGEFSIWNESGEEFLNVACSGGAAVSLTEPPRLPVPTERPDAAAHTLAPVIQRLVTRARFNAGRAHTPYEFERDLRELGCEVFDSVRRFLTQYGGLTFEQKYATHSSSLLFHTGGAAAAGKTTREMVAQWEQRLNVKLCPVGEGGYESYVLLMDEHGRAFGLQLDAMTAWGDSPKEFIEGLCTSAGIIPVTDGDRWPDIEPTGV